MEKLAIDGGSKVRNRAMPGRRLFGEQELARVAEVFEHSWKTGRDFGYDGEYEARYTAAFCEFQGGGFADAVCSGTAGIYIAMQSLGMERGGDVIVSPVTDPGGVSPVILLGHNIVVCDSEVGGFNIGPEQLEAAITDKTTCAVITHVGGHPVDMKSIMEIARRHEIKIIEDCSQSHGSLYCGQRVGRFGDIAVFSTMFSKNHATGGCGGLVYTQNEKYYNRVKSLSDRGKSFFHSNYDPKDPGTFEFAALNMNQDELSCAIGISTLSKLQDTIDRRLEIADKIDKGLSGSSVVFECKHCKDSVPSIFFHTVGVDIDKLGVSKEYFARAVAAEGIGINPHYKYLVSQWPWVCKYLSREAITPNAVDFQNRSFNILFNERYGDEEVNDIIKSIIKVEKVLSR